MAYVDFTMKLHKSTERDYRGRVLEHDKAECAEVALRYGKEYWDGDRKHGYGGYRYDGRWRPIAEAMARHYGLKSADRILDVGCGKGFLLHEFTQILSGCRVAGVDISRYAIENSKQEIRPFLKPCGATELPFPDNSFDFVVSVNALHNLYLYELKKAVCEIERVGKGKKKHIIIETYRNEREKANLLYWQLTCRSFHTPEEWEWLFQEWGYSGDYSYVVFD